MQQIKLGGTPVVTAIYIVLAVVIAVVATVLVTVPIAGKRAVEKKAHEDAETIGSAEEKARNIIDDALRTAETKKREALLEVKEESLKLKNEQDRENRERRAELQKYERRVLSKEESVERKSDALERKESNLSAKETELNRKKKQVDELQEKRVQELERISGFTSEQAKEYLLKSVEDEVKVDVARLYKELSSQAKNDASRKAQEYVVTAIQKCAVDHVSETTISVVELPSDEMKGRIIGREGRNIKALENATGVDLIIDDTPEAVVLSSFDPIRREVARIALEKLIIDGRIHPARIEEMVEKARREVDARIREAGEAAAMEVGVRGIHPELIRLLGRMTFRTSYGQNALQHSIEVAQLCGLLAGEIGLDVRMAKRAGLLHDIGKSIDHELEGSHIQIGADLCRKYKEPAIVINSVESHHGDVEQTSLISCIVQAADAISASRPGARRETLDAYTNRLKDLENITNSFKGVEKSFAIQAGREVRVMVVPEQVDDAQMVLLARDISKQIEAELEYPGQIKVNVIRESRVTDFAK
ncbi:MAG TPA: ribonuclease Y [Lachnospiraceae bacterium]|nr:ribonuclease Y [Lachnospiraceae bacterium]